MICLSVISNTQEIVDVSFDRDRWNQVLLRANFLNNYLKMISSSEMVRTSSYSPANITLDILGMQKKR